MPRPRTTKGLAKRIEQTYYKKPHPFRWWWRVLCWTVPAVGTLWLLVMAVLGDQRVYTSGRVVTAHLMFDAQCDRCHLDLAPPVAPVRAVADGQAAATPAVAKAGVHRGGWFFRRVSDGACLGCHDGTVHHETQTELHPATAPGARPTCPACHVEHVDGSTLKVLSDRHCTQCHANLPPKTKGGAPKFEHRVVSLREHPEFGLIRKKLKDEAQIKLSHEVHLKPDLPAGGGKRVTLGCAACHVTDPAGRYMLPVSYKAHCAQCHPLDTGADLMAPHDRPEIIRGFLMASLTARRGAVAPASGGAGTPAPAAPAEEKKEEEPKGRRRGGGSTGFLLDGLLELVGWPSGGSPPSGILLAQRQRGGAPAPAEAPKEAPAKEDSGQPGGRRRGGGDAPAAAPAERAAPAAAPGGLAAVAQIEKELFTGRSGCKYCHTLEEGEAGLPKVVPTKIPVRWLPQSTFDHRAHRGLTCAGCHEGAAKSVETADVLMPGIKVCQECHGPSGGARSGCVECHVYHDPKQERTPDGVLSRPQFRVGPKAAAPTPSPPKTP